MKYAEFNIDTNKIEFLNSTFGIESVLLNGKRISKKFSFYGIIHNIKLNSQNLTLESKYNQFYKSEIKFELKEKRKTSRSQNCQSRQKTKNLSDIYWNSFRSLGI